MTGNRSESIWKAGRAKALLVYAGGMKISVICRKFGLTRRVVKYAIDKALNLGISGAISDLPRSGRSRRITDDARNWTLDLACRRPVDLGYATETWTCSALIKHIRENCTCKIGKSVLNSIMLKGNIRPHKVSYIASGRNRPSPRQSISTRQGAASQQEVY